MIAVARLSLRLSLVVAAHLAGADLPTLLAVETLLDVGERFGDTG